MDLLLPSDLYNVLGQYEGSIETIRRWHQLEGRDRNLCYDRNTTMMNGQLVLSSVKEVPYKLEILGWIKMRLTGWQLSGLK